CPSGARGSPRGSVGGCRLAQRLRREEKRAELLEAPSSNLESLAVSLGESRGVMGVEREEPPLARCRDRLEPRANHPRLAQPGKIVQGDCRKSGLTERFRLLRGGKGELPGCGELTPRGRDPDRCYPQRRTIDSYHLGAGVARLRQRRACLGG